MTTLKCPATQHAETSASDARFLNSPLAGCRMPGMSPGSALHIKTPQISETRESAVFFHAALLRFSPAFVRTGAAHLGALGGRGFRVGFAATRPPRTDCRMSGMNLESALRIKRRRRFQKHANRSCFPMKTVSRLSDLREALNGARALSARPHGRTLLPLQVFFPGSPVLMSNARDKSGISATH